MKAWLIARNTLRQTIRQRLFYNVIVFGVGMTLFAMVVANITFGYPDRTVRSIGLGGVTIALDLMALLVSVSLIHEEIDRRTIFVVLARPLRRWEYVLGRYLGLLLTLCLAWLGLVAVFLITLFVARGTPTLNDLLALFAVIPEAAIIGGVGLVLSAFSTPTLSAGIAIGIWIAGTAVDDLVRLTQKADELTRGIATVASYVLPALARLNFREQSIYALPIDPTDYALSLLYAAVYSAMLVAFSSAILDRREMI